MRRLRKLDDGSMAVVESLADAAERVYVLAPEGATFVTDLLHLHAGDEIRASDLRLMLDRGWANLLEPPAPAPTPPRSAPPAQSAIPPARSTAAQPRDDRAALSRRTRGREVALQVLYLIEQNPGVAEADLDQFLLRRLREPKLVAFAQNIVSGVRQRLKHIDNLISEVAENWRIDRMAAIDRNILRVGAYEMLYADDVPNKVAINEALELAKRYSTAQSSRFVNGILDRLQNAQPEPSDQAAEADAQGQQSDGQDEPEAVESDPAAPGAE